MLCREQAQRHRENSGMRRKAAPFSGEQGRKERAESPYFLIPSSLSLHRIVRSVIEKWQKN